MTKQMSTSLSFTFWMINEKHGNSYKSLVLITSGSFSSGQWPHVSGRNNESLCVFFSHSFFGRLISHPFVHYIIVFLFLISHRCSMYRRVLLLLAPVFGCCCVPEAFAVAAARPGHSPHLDPHWNDFKVSTLWGAY